MPQKFANNAQSVLVSGITAVATSLTIETLKADLFPQATTTTWVTPLDFFKLVLSDGVNREVVRVGIRAFNSPVMSNILRAQDGTTALAFPNGATVICGFVARDVDDINVTLGAQGTQIFANAATAAADTAAGDALVRADLANKTDTAKGSALAGFSDPVAPAYLKTMSDIVNGERVSLFRFINTALHSGLRSGTDPNTDLTVSVQTAFDAGDTAAYNLYLPPVAKHIRTTSVININFPISVQGGGVTPYLGAYANTRGRGSWFYFDHLGIGFNVARAADSVNSGVNFQGIGTARNQPVPSAAWTPAAADFDIAIKNTDVYVENVMLYNPTKGIAVTKGNGRLNINKLFGQPMQVGINIDELFDVMTVSNLHWWPFWQDNTNIHAYTMQNCDGLYLNRCDNPKFTNIFSIFQRSGMRYGQNAAGKTLKSKVVNADFDRGKYGIWVDSTVTSGVIGFHENITHQGESGVAGSAMVKVDGGLSNLYFGAVRTDACGISAIDVAGANNVLHFASASLFNYNADAIAAPAINSAASNTVSFGKKPLISAGTFYGGTGLIFSDDYRSWTPTISAATGTVTTLGTVDAKYKILGDDVAFTISINITTNGTAAGDIRFTLPVNSIAATFQFSGARTTAGRLMLSGFTATNIGVITKYDNTYAGVDGSTLVCSGIYRRA